MKDSFCRIGPFNSGGDKHNVMMGDEKSMMRFAYDEKKVSKDLTPKPLGFWGLSIKTAGTVREFEVPFKNHMLEYVY